MGEIIKNLQVRPRGETISTVEAGLQRREQIRTEPQHIDRALGLLKGYVPQLQTLPVALQQIIAVYLMQQLAQYRSAQDLCAMIEEINSEWAERMKDIDIEMLLRAGIDIVSDSDSYKRKTRQRIRSSVDLMSDKRRKVQSATKQSLGEGMTSGSKLSAQTQSSKSQVKADTNGPIAELIITRVKSDDKPKIEEAEKDNVIHPIP
jgi:hypothetical protein